MKTIKMIAFGLLATLFYACSEDEETIKRSNVKFELDASSLKLDQETRTFTPSYGKNGFSIYVFRLSGNSYVFEKSIDIANMVYSASTQTLSGEDELPVGTYKFVPVYGIENQAGLSIQEYPNMILDDNLAVQYNPETELNEIFLPTVSDMNNLRSYEVVAGEDMETVTATLRRAVSRVDLLFLSGSMVNGKFEEKVYPNPSGTIFGGKQIEKLELRYTNINNQINLFGRNLTITPSNQIANINLLDQKVVIGNGSTTLIGTENYGNYDNVQPGDIISGGAHIFGSNLLSNNDESRTVGLEIFIKPVGGVGRNIPITTLTGNNLPIVKNKVTLVKIYVLNEKSFFDIDAEFEVFVETAWDNPNESTGDF